MPAGEYTLVESFALEYQWNYKQLVDGDVVSDPLAIKSYYVTLPKVINPARSANPSVALFRSGLNDLVLCRVPQPKCSPDLTWLSLERPSTSVQTARVAKHLDGVCVVSRTAASRAPHNKSLERTREG